MDELSKLFAVMEAQETRLLGIAHCIVPKEEEEIPIIEPLFVPPNEPIPEEIKAEEDKAIESELQAIIPNEEEITNKIGNAQDEAPEKGILVAPDDVPSVILSSLMKSATVAITDQPIKEIILTTTTESPMPNPDENSIQNNIDIVSRTEPSIELIESSVDTVPLIVENVTVYNKLENRTVLAETTPSSSNPKSFIPQSSTPLPLPPAQPQQTTTETPDIPKLSTSPSIAEIILGELESISKSPEPDNYIYETFSPIAPVNTAAISSPSLQRNEHLVLPEEPPEAVPAA